MDQLAEVSSRLYKLESRIDDVPTYIKQVILQQINLQQQWVEFKLKHSNEDTSEKGQSEFKKDVQNLEEKIELIPTYMKELNDMQSSLYDGWLDAKIKLEEAIKDAKRN